MAEHRFRDEWIVRVIQQLPGITPNRVAQWRAERRPYIAQAVMESGEAGFEKVAAAVKKTFRIDSVSLPPTPPDKTLLALVPEKVVRQHQVLPVRAEPRRIEVAMINPLDDAAVQAVRWAASREVVPLYCAPDQLEVLLRSALSTEAVIHNLLERIEAPLQVEVLGAAKEEVLTGAQAEVRGPVIKLVNALIADAVTRRASDIHIEHDEHNSLVRFRIDGLLRNVMVLPRYLGVGPVVSRIKIMAQLDVSDRLRPQDGRAKIRVGGEEVGLRVSTLPTRVGEKVVMRILNERAVQVSLETLGFAPALLDRIRDLVARKQGIVLVTGPTGSGKTTTLYAALNARRSESVNVVTVEDPIEYKLSGINQVQVNEKQGLTFASVLRSVLRQDPDVVLVGEIRDQETASVAIQAAMTGHLVLSTLHTNDAVGAVTRLRDMGVDPFKIGAALLGVTAQRLVRRSCSSCSTAAPLAELNPVLQAALSAAGLPVRHMSAPGCIECGFSGFQGRFPVSELLEMSPTLRDAISAGSSTEELRALAEADGALHTMEQDSLYHLSHGHTTQDELLPHLELDRLRTPTAKAPIEQPRKNSAAAPEDSAERPQAVLVVSADAARREATVKVAAAAGVRVLSAADGASALGMMTREPAHLLIADLALPGLDGLQVMRTANTVLGLDLATILLLAESDHARAEDLLDQGALDVVLLPATPAEIVERATAALQRKHGWSDVADVMRAPVPINESARLDALRRTKLLDSAPDERFDKLTRTAQRLFDVPIALVSLVDQDRQWSKSNQGLALAEAPRDLAFCSHAVNSTDMMVVPDTVLDPRFSENPLVTGDPHIRFYAGYPISGPGGYKIGTLCIMDRKPRVLSQEDEASLADLGALVEDEINRG